MNPNEENAGRKPFTIIVNGREKEWSKTKITFREVVVLAYGVFEDNPLISYPMTYKQSEHQPKDGTLDDNDEITAHPGMIFNVTRTDRS